MRGLLNRLRQQRGAAAMSIVLGFMALAIPAVTATLAFTSTATLSSSQLRNTGAAQFTVTGAMEYAIYKLTKVSGFKEGLSPGSPFYEFITLNDSEGAITWTKRNTPGGSPPDGVVQLSTTLVADTATVPASTPTDVTYTIEVTNIGLATVTVDDVRAGMGWNVDYNPGTTTGITTSDPVVTYHASSEGGLPYPQLRWDLDHELPASETLTINFSAEIDTPDRWLCAAAWANPGGQDASSGPSAKIQVGEPAGTLCLQEAIEVRKTVTPSIGSAGVQQTYTYRIEVENHDTVMHDYRWVVDLLPAGITYVGGSQQQNIGSLFNGPFITYEGGRQELFWLINPYFGLDELDPGEVKYLQFDASGTLNQGVHTNEAWIYFWWIGDHAYSFPTAEITIWDVYDISVSNESVVVQAQVWLGEGDTYHVTEWQINDL